MLSDAVRVRTRSDSNRGSHRATIRFAPCAMIGGTQWDPSYVECLHAHGDKRIGKLSLTLIRVTVL